METISLNVREDNANAIIALYLKSGFTQYGYLSNGYKISEKVYVNKILMKKDII